VLTCPGCRSTNVDVTATLRGAGEPRWHGRCLDCEQDWDFDDV
jgi:transposase-like protein